jgi:hypothetical protein
MTKKKIALDVVNPFAAGIDVGSRSHYVAIGQTDEDVREFGVYNEDLIALAQWLLDNEIKTVAMEALVRIGKAYLLHFKVWDLKYFSAMENLPRTLKERRPMFRIVSGYKSFIPLVY